MKTLGLLLGIIVVLLKWDQITGVKIQDTTVLIQPTATVTTAPVLQPVTVQRGGAADATDEVHLQRRRAEFQRQRAEVDEQLADLRRRRAELEQEAERTRALQQQIQHTQPSYLPAAWPNAFHELDAYLKFMDAVQRNAPRTPWLPTQ